MAYIPKTKKPRPKAAKYSERQGIYGTKKWKELRLSKLQKDPMCEVCMLEGKTKLAEDVHHLDSFMNYNDMMREYKAFDFKNLISVCRNCHISKFHAKDGYLRNCKTIEEVKNKIEDNKNKPQKR